MPAPPRLAKPPLLLPAQLPAMLRPPNRPSESESERASEALHTPARHSTTSPEPVTPRTESDMGSDAPSLSPWQTPLPLTPETPVVIPSPPPAPNVAPPPDAGLRRSTRTRHAPDRYSPTSYYCYAVNSNPLPSARNRARLELQHNTLTSLTILLILFMTVCPTVHGELLSSQLGPAKLCSKHADGQYFDLGQPPTCKIERKFSQIENIFVTPFFRKTLSDTFPIYSCIFEIVCSCPFLEAMPLQGIV